TSAPPGEADDAGARRPPGARSAGDRDVGGDPGTARRGRVVDRVGHRPAPLPDWGPPPAAESGPRRPSGEDAAGMSVTHRRTCPAMAWATRSGHVRIRMEEPTNGAEERELRFSRQVE